MGGLEHLGGGLCRGAKLPRLAGENVGKVAGARELDILVGEVYGRLDGRHYFRQPG